MRNNNLILKVKEVSCDTGVVQVNTLLMLLIVDTDEKEDYAANVIVTFCLTTSPSFSFTL